MTERTANLEMQAYADKQWQVGKHFHKIPPARKKQTFWSKLVKIVFSK